MNENLAGMIAEFIRIRIAEDEADYRKLNESLGAGQLSALDPSNGEYLDQEQVNLKLVEWLLDDYNVDDPIPALVTIARMWQTHPDFAAAWLHYA